MENPGAVVELGARFRDALEWAAILHAAQTRKGTTTPYIGHLLGVCAIVIAAGGDEDQAIAALLHDAVEDQGVALADVEARFDHRVACIVEACTDSFTLPKLDWRERKEAYLARLPHEPEEALLVVVADKLDNMRAMLADFRATGPQVFERFNGKRVGTLWYYGAALDVLTERFPHQLTAELAAALAELRSAASTD